MTEELRALQQQIKVFNVMTCEIIAIAWKPHRRLGHIHHFQRRLRKGLLLAFADHAPRQCHQATMDLGRHDIVTKYQTLSELTDTGKAAQ